MRVLAIDPGFGRCGLAILEGDATHPQLIFSTCVETKSTTDFSLRLLDVGNNIVQAIKDYQPEQIAIEELYFSNNQKTAFAVAEARGMILYIAAVHQIPLVEFNPMSVKVAVTGYGRANKTDVTSMVKRLVHITDAVRKDDEYDAIAVGITALAHARVPK